MRQLWKSDQATGKDAIERGRITEGRLFSSSHLDDGEWNEIQFEFHEYRNGMMRFKLTGVWVLLGAYEFIGHSGSNSSFAFYCPDEELYIVGTLN